MNKFAVNRNLETGRGWLKKRGFSQEKDASWNWLSENGGILVSEPFRMEGDTPTEMQWNATMTGCELVGFGGSPSEAIVDLVLSHEKQNGFR